MEDDEDQQLADETAARLRTGFGHLLELEPDPDELDPGPLDKSQGMT